MTRKGILLTLAAMAVGLLVLGAIGTPEARAAEIWGQLWSYLPPELGDTMTVYCQERESIQPMWQKCAPLKDPPPGGPFWDDYSFTRLPVGVYDVWAVVEIGEWTCTSQKYEVEIIGGTQVTQQDITIYMGDCN